jgi:hypothetical protein
MQRIKQLINTLSVCGCMSCLHICLYVKFEILQKACRQWVVHVLTLVDRFFHSRRLTG